MSKKTSATETRRDLKHRNTLSKKAKSKSHIATKRFPIVGIGASAGGLEAIIELLMNIPPDTGMAFVIVPHLDPTHESMLSEILSRKTLMPVAEIKKNARVQADHVYVIPRNTNLTILHGVLKLLARVENKGIHLPIDAFFKSLAKDQKSNCVGIILSGTASDGARGLRAIKAEGGLTIAQDPKSAKYDGMPLSAIAAGVVNLVLPPKKIGEELARIARHSFIMDENRSLPLPTRDLNKSDTESVLNKILTLLHNKCYVDFSHYKRGTLIRRLSRRMLLLKKKHLKDYLEYLETHPDEIECLFADILINVTEFFRDPNAFAQLKTRIFPEIMKNREANSPVRIWVVGCASGEEAYSVIISLLEFIDDPDAASIKKSIQVFATDVSESAIQKARAGIYSESSIKSISKERLQRFFTKTETGSYRIKNFIRDICLFSLHDLTSDPPYSKLDLLCCRNLLIYFDQTLQERILPIFHYALKPDGFLWLGHSENIGKSLPLLFNPIDKVHKFFSRKPITTMQKFHFPSKSYLPEKLDMAEKLTGKTIYRSTTIMNEIDHIASLKYAPPGVVVSNSMEIIHIRGEMTPYLQLAAGQPSFNLFNMARAELASDLRITLREAKKKNAPSRKNNCILQVGGQRKIFSIDVIPFTFTLHSQIEERYFLISFEPELSAAATDLPVRMTANKTGKPHVDSQAKYIKELEQEQSDSKKHQTTLIQDFEMTQEELISSNEELQTTLEELQSTNEELETAKEELQSVNEELTTINDELQNRNTDLAKLNDDLINLLACVDIPIVMLDMNGCIRRFTPKASQTLNLILTDIGRPISNINPNFDKLDLGPLVSEVIDTTAIHEMNIQDRNGKWYRLQVRPYKTTDKKVDGAIITLVDINLLKQDLVESETSLDYANSIANTVHLPLVVLDKKLRLKSANNAFYNKFRITKEDEGADLLTLIGTNNERVSEVRKALTVAFISNIELKNFEVEYKLSSAKNGTMLLNGRRIKWIDKNEPNALLLSIEDITDRLNMEKSLKKAIAESRKSSQSKDIFLAMLSHELRTPLTVILCWTQLLLKMNEGSQKLKLGLEAIEQNSKIQGQMIDDLLDISRIQSGKLILSNAQLDLVDIVRQAVESVRLLTTNKSISIKTHIKALNGYVTADSARLQQIIWNLLTNAIKFSPPKKVIDVQVKPVMKQGQPFAAIQVIDQGKGIKSDFLPQLFERFTQADSTTTRLDGGLGLGLPIAHDLLKLMGGRIQAKSSGVGKGAAFTVLLPLIPQEMNQKMQAKFKKLTAKGGDPLWQSLRGLSILIVEDEPHSLNAFTELLKFAGAKTISVTSAADTMIALDNYQPDILISDIAMPEKDGISLIQNIRANSTAQKRQIPAIALTAYATKEDINRVLKAGFSAHIAKPFNAVDLIICVANLVSGKPK